MSSYDNKRFIFKIALIATLGGLLFGYDTAVISGAEQSLQKYITLGYGSFIHGITVSSALIGCIIGGLLSSNIFTSCCNLIYSISNFIRISRISIL